MSATTSVTVTAVDNHTLFESVITFVGVTNDDESSFVRFGLDHGPAADVALALQAGEDVVIDLEPWQILGAFK